MKQVSIGSNNGLWSSQRQAIIYINAVFLSIIPLGTTWWRHQMETFSALLALCAGNSPATSEFPTQRPVTWSVDVFIDLHLNNGSVNNREAGDLKRHHGHFDVTVMKLQWIFFIKIQNFSFMKMHLKISPAKWQPFCPWEDQLTVETLLPGRLTYPCLSHRTDSLHL